MQVEGGKAEDNSRIYNDKLEEVIYKKVYKILFSNRCKVVLTFNITTYLKRINYIKILIKCITSYYLILYHS